MKKSIKLFFATTALGTILSIPTFAAETKAEYKEAATPIIYEIKNLNDDLSKIREENILSAQNYKNIRLSLKQNKNLTEKENWLKAKDLRKQIIEIRKNINNESIKELYNSKKVAMQNKDYNSALSSLQNILTEKENKLNLLKQIRGIWDNIDSLLKAE